MDWFLYASDLSHERVKFANKYCEVSNGFIAYWLVFPIFVLGLLDLQLSNCFFLFCNREIKYYEKSENKI